MTPRINLSAACERTSPPAISSLMQQALANPGLISLAAGFVDQKSLPVEATARAVAALLGDSREGLRALQYGTTIGDLGFRSRLVAHLERGERVPAGTFRSAIGRTVVTSGSQQLLYLVAEALVDPGDIVLVEAPTYFVYLGLLETRGARAIGVATDDHGLRLDALESTLAEIEERGELDRVKLIYTVTEHSNPTGISLAPERRGPLVEIARRWSKSHRIYVLEDAAYRGLTFSGTEPPSVWSHDRAGDTVILSRSFSKTYSPGLKTGFGVLPEALVEPVLRLKGNHDFGSGNFAQVLLERLLADGSYDRHVETLVALYRRKRDVMLGALEEHFEPFEGAVSWTRPNGGLFVWLTVPEGLDTGPGGPLWSRSLDEGVLYVPGALAFADAPGQVVKNHARLCFGVPAEADLREGARRLASAVTHCLDPVA
jgi:2-aminoadipate transaminase